MEMRFIKYVLPLFILLTLGQKSWAQPLRAQTYNQMLEVAQESADKGYYYNAREWFQKAYDEQRDKRLVPVIAKLSYQLRDLEKAEKYYARLWKSSRSSNKIDFTEDRYWYGVVLKENGKYEEAIAEFNQYITDSENEEGKKMASFQLDGIMALSKLEPNVDVAVRFAGKELNSPSGEASPRTYRDGSLYYGSYNRKSIIEVGGDEEDYHSKIFMASRTDEGFSKPVALGEQVNRFGFHSSNLSFSEDGRVMYFTRSTLSGSEVAESKIYVSYRKDEDWSPAVEATGINGEYIAQHPAAGELFGKNVLFFVSDMDGGYGGKDIYYVNVNGDGSFSTPTNLGEGINTSGDEVTPFYIDGQMFYSTNGLPTIGGFDIMKTTWDGSNWSASKNLGFNYNSAYDDLYFSMNADAKAGYLVSNRPDDGKKKLKSITCCDDIYVWNIREVIIDLIATTTDAEKNPLNGTTMVLKNLTQVFTPETKNIPDANEYQFTLDADNEYKLVIKKEGYYPDSIMFNTAGIIDDFTVKRSIELKPIPKVVEPEEPEYETITTNQAIRLNNIYYDFDDDKILLDAEKDLTVLYDLMIKYPTMVIELSSHTDSRGLSRYNQDLSQRRAESARNWLLNKGIAEDRIKPVGYGEEIIINRCVDGVRCEDDEHRINRRTEFKIIDGPKTIEIKRDVLKKGSNSQGSVTPKTPKSKALPVLTFKQSLVDLGEVKRGETPVINYQFSNTGNADLNIEVVTACKCTELTWPRKAVAPGESGKIKVIFDSSTFEPGKITKIVDVISNTEPLITEAKFTATIIE